MKYSSILATIALASGLSSCGDADMTLKQPLVYSFEHQLPESYYKNNDFSSEEFDAITDDGILFRGFAMRSTDVPSEVVFDVGMQFKTKAENKKIFVEALKLAADGKEKERRVEEHSDIDVKDKHSGIFFKRVIPFKGVTIPLEAKAFSLRVDYKIDESPTEQITIKLDNVSFRGPIL